MGLREAPPSDERRGGLGEAEVEQLRAAFGQDDVARLQIAMDDPVAMRGRQGVRNLDAALQSVIERQRSSFEPRGERSPSRYSITRKSTILVANVVQRADVRVGPGWQSPWLRGQSARATVHRS